MRSALVIVAALFATTGYAHTPEEELQVVRVALKYHFENAQTPIRDNTIVVGHETEALAPNTRDQKARKDFIERNEERIAILPDGLPRNFVITDLSKFEREREFDWENFLSTFPTPYATLRVARPGFSDAAHAVVRFDLKTPAQEGPTRVTYRLAFEKGEWRVLDGVSRSIEIER